MLKIGVLHSTIRAEEKLIKQAGEERGVEIVFIDVRKEILDPQNSSFDADIFLERCISTTQGSYVSLFLESMGKRVVNSCAIARICSDKFLTSLALAKGGVPTPPFALAFGFEEARRAVASMGGYPVVLKPAVGSWGRLIAKINDEDALEALVEHKDFLGSTLQKPIYIQQYVEKPGRDIRVFAIDGEAICAIYRDSKHWITNTARGANASNCPITSEISAITQKASKVVGGGILALDLFETPTGLSVNEINHTMEFRNSEAPTGVSISGAIVDYCMRVLEESKQTNKNGK